MVDGSAADFARLGLFLGLRGRRVLVVGGGRIGERRISTLLAAGAKVTLVSPQVSENLSQLARDGEITWEQREYQSSDLLRWTLTQEAEGGAGQLGGIGSAEGAPGESGEQPTGRADTAEGKSPPEGAPGDSGEQPGGWADTAEGQSPPEGALGESGEQPGPPHVATSVDGESVRPSRYWLVHTATGTTIDGTVAEDAEKAGVWCIRADSGTDSAAIIGAGAKGPDEIRVAVASGDPRRSNRIARSIAQSLSTGDLPIRRTRESESGWVALVGGGPGEPGLLTLRGRQLLALADVVVTDRLGPISVLTELEDDVRIVDVGKSPGYHPVPQDEINEILVVEAKAGLHVVRLKGGDPFVLGRGAEEARFCQEHDVQVEWVPGVTSAVSVPAAAGIPVTHRATSPAFIVASGHESPEAAAATPPETTVLLLMGVLHLEETAQLLMVNGRGPETPVAIVEKGWTPAQRTTRTDLGSCALAVAERSIRPPAVVVVGPAAALADVLGPVTPVVAR